MFIKKSVVGIFFAVLLVAAAAHGSAVAGGPVAGGPSGYGIVACDGAVFIDNALVGNYQGSASANVQTCSAGADIFLAGKAIIAGNASAAGSVIVTGRAKVKGAVSQNQPPAACDPLGVVTLVEGKRPAGSPVSINLSGNKTRTLVAPGPFYLSGLSLSGNSVLNIAGSGNAVMFIDGDLRISGLASFNVSKGVTLTIYITGNIIIDGVGTLSQAPLDCIYASAEKGNLVWISGDSNFYGALYAPFSTVYVSGNSAFIGSLRGMTVDASGNATFQLVLPAGAPPLPGLPPSFGSEIYSFSTPSTNAPPVTCSITGNAAAGQRIVVLAIEDGNYYQVSGVTDSKGNSYSQLLFYDNNTGYSESNECIWSAYVTNPLTAGADTITITWSALYPSPPNQGFAVSIVTLNNTQQYNQPDSTAENNAYSAGGAVSIPGTTVAANTISVGLLTANNFAWTIGNGTLYDSQKQNIYYDFFYHVNTSAGPYDPGGTGTPAPLTYSGAWVALK